VNPRPDALHIEAGLTQHDVAGLKLDYLTPEEFVRLLLGRSVVGPGFCCVPNAHQCVEAHKDRSFGQAVGAATFRLSDSRILDLARRFLHGVPALPTLKGAGLLLHVARAAAAEGRRIGFFGGSEETLAKLERRLRTEIPGCEIGYSFSPPFGGLSELGDASFAEAINRAGIDILFVGLGCPKQEWWMYRNRHRVQPFMLGVGAAFDFVAGTKRASPDWVHRMGLEWLYRFVQEPRRLWRRYVVYGPLFIRLVLKQKFSRQNRQPAG
jgi:N-acetylglucosaminyldiphosphoundecaprenol N-acetyl-beta-D-mannosaminyltransferase